MKALSRGGNWLASDWPGSTSHHDGFAAGNAQPRRGISTDNCDFQPAVGTEQGDDFAGTVLTLGVRDAANLRIAALDFHLAARRPRLDVVGRNV